MNTLYEKSKNSNLVAINPFYKEMYYPPLPKIDEEEKAQSTQQVVWAHMMNISVQNTVNQSLQKVKVA